MQDFVGDAAQRPAPQAAAAMGAHGNEVEFLLRGVITDLHSILAVGHGGRGLHAALFQTGDVIINRHEMTVLTILPPDGGKSKPHSHPVNSISKPDYKPCDHPARRVARRLLFK